MTDGRRTFFKIPSTVLSIDSEYTAVLEARGAEGRTLNDSVAVAARSTERIALW